MSEKCPYCQTKVSCQMNTAVDYEFCWNDECDYQTNIYYNTNDYSQVREIKEVAPSGYTLLVEEDGNVIGSGNWSEEELDEFADDDDFNYIIHTGEENRVFEMKIDEPNKIKNIEQENVDRVIQNA